MFHGCGKGNGIGSGCGCGNVERWILPLPLPQLTQFWAISVLFSFAFGTHMCYRRCRSQRRRPSTSPLGQPSL